MPRVRLPDALETPEGIPTAARLPRGFHADQGALFLTGGAAEAITERPGALVAALVAAVEQALHIGKATADALTAAAPLLKSLSAQARGALLADLLLCADPATAVDLAERTGLLGQILPDMGRLRAMPHGQGRYKDVYSHTLRVLAATPPDLITRLAALLHDSAKPDTLVIEGGAAHFPNHDLLGADRAARRLRGLGFAEDLVSGVETLVRLHLRVNSYEPSWTDSAVRRLHLDAGDQWERLLDLSYADVTSARADVVARAHRRVQELAAHATSLDKPVEVSPLDGTALMAHFGRGPGRWIGDVKRELIACVQSGDLDPADHEAAWRLAEALVAGLPED